MTPATTTKYSYDGSWSLRATINGGPHLHPLSNTRADYIDRTSIAYSIPPIVEMIAAIITYDLRYATITDYLKFFLYLKSLPVEVAANCTYFQGRYWYFTGKQFGARATPFVADCFGDLLQRVQTFVMRAAGIDAHIYRRTDDQCILTHSKQDNASANTIFTQVCGDANVAVQNDKRLVAVQQFTFDGYRFDLAARTISIPTDKMQHLLKHTSTLVKHAQNNTPITRARCEKFTGFLEWVAAVVFQLKPRIQPFRQCWISLESDEQHVHLSPSAISELKRINTWARDGDITVHMSSLFTSAADLSLYTDGSGTGGVGGYTSRGDVFSYALPGRFNQHAHDSTNVEGGLSSQWVELAALYIALHTLKHLLTDLTLDWWTDSLSACTAYKNQRSTSSNSNYLLTQIDHLSLIYNITIQPRWHPRTHPAAQVADDLSKFDTSSVCSQVHPTKQHTVNNLVLKNLTRSISSPTHTSV
eukprot:m.118560 g.118560  ORF g.118560 m.118560 type:complete len:473 (-) comp28674_c0_seq3:1681-3099(-)